MKRKVILSERASLWEAGDAARSIGLLEEGKLGVMTDKGLVGTILPGMMIGESAIYTLLGERPQRTASVFAVEEGTTVTEFSVFHFKQQLDDGNYDFAQQILLSLMVQSCRNLELVAKANEQLPLVTASVNTMMRRITESYSAQLEKVTSWDSFIQLFRYLYQFRDFSEAVRRDLVVYTDKNEIARVSETVQTLFNPSIQQEVAPRLPIKDKDEPVLERFEAPSMSDRFQARRQSVKPSEELHRFNE
jgi:CRP-like cAMP-binding protein